MGVLFSQDEMAGATLRLSFFLATADFSKTLYIPVTELLKAFQLSTDPQFCLSKAANENATDHCRPIERRIHVA
jgi:hypothetical protein